MDEAVYQNHYEVQEKHWWFKAKKQIIMSMIRQYANLSSTKKVLDAGCGTGLMLNELKAIGEVSGMDFSDDAIQFSQKKFAGVIKKGELPSNIPYANNSFDLLIALDVVEHIEDDVGALTALRNLLTPQGLAVLTVPAYMFLWSDHDVVNQHKRRYTLSEFETKIKKAGFKIEKISYYNTFLFLPAFLVRTVNKLLNRHSGTDTDLPGKLTNFILFKIFNLEKFFLKYINFPFGVSVIAVVRK